MQAQLRRAAGPVGTHLSSGRDSGVVAAIAASLLGQSGEQLLAYTGAPAEGFAKRAPPHLLVVEGPLAGELVARHPTIRHRLCRCPAEAPLSMLEHLQQVQAAPLPTPSNLPWWLAVNAQAAADGVTVLLTGQAGNYSVSAGGPAALRDLAQEGAWRLATAGAWRFGRGAGVRPVAARLLGPVMPAWLYPGLRVRVGSARAGERRLPLLREPWRRRAEALRCERTADRRPPASYRGFLRDSLLGIDNGERISATLFGLDVRDPTADRRLVEMVCSFPAAAWYGGGERPAFEQAFAGRLPPTVLHPRSRAYQQADWFEQFTPDAVRAAFHRYSAHPFVAELIDDRAVDIMVDAWPRGTDWMAVPERFARIEDEYRNQLLPTLAVAAFIWAHCPY